MDWKERINPEVVLKREMKSQSNLGEISFIHSAAVGKGILRSFSMKSFQRKHRFLPWTLRIGRFPAHQAVLCGRCGLKIALPSLGDESQFQFFDLTQRMNS
jgi:hypothetical protein